MTKLLLRLIIPGTSIAIAGVLAVTLGQTSGIGQRSSDPSAAAASQVSHSSATEPVFPNAPAAADQAQILSNPTLPARMAVQDAQAIQAIADPTPPPARTGSASAPNGDCTVRMTATPRAAAMLSIEVAAPCAPDTRVEIRHEGLVLAGVTNAEGNAFVTVAALVSPALVVADLADGSSAQARIVVADLGDYHRVVLQTGALEDLEMHVLEGLADYGTPGHVHPGNPRTIAHALSGNGGFLTFLGDPRAPDPLLAQAYTFPKSAPDTPVITVEAAVTSANCGQPRRAMALQSLWGAPSDPMEIHVDLPECDAAGDFLILPGIFDPTQAMTN
jgi:hypothetical protein